MGKTLVAAIASNMFLLFMDFLLLPASAPNSVSKREFRVGSLQRKILPGHVIFFEKGELEPA
jgi:hypothetical protein